MFHKVFKGFLIKPRRTKDIITPLGYRKVAFKPFVVNLMKFHISTVYVPKQEMVERSYGSNYSRRWAWLSRVAMALKVSNIPQEQWLLQQRCFYIQSKQGRKTSKRWNISLYKNINQRKMLICKNYFFAHQLPDIWLVTLIAATHYQYKSQSIFANPNQSLWRSLSHNQLYPYHCRLRLWQREEPAETDISGSFEWNAVLLPCPSWPDWPTLYAK